MPCQPLTIRSNGTSRDGAATWVTSHVSVDRVLEQIERYEEDLTDRVRVHGELKVIIEVGEAVEVSPVRDRTAKVDPIMNRIESELTQMLDRLAHESRVYET